MAQGGVEMFLEGNQQQRSSKDFGMNMRVYQRLQGQSKFDKGLPTIA
jgi:hypothetical protein